jgi:hypothetical protein
MPRTPFEDIDRRAASRLAEKLAEPCTWRPWLFRGPDGDAYTINRSAGADPSRPVRADLVAIPTWRSGVSRDEGNATAGGQLIVDIERQFFDDTPEHPGGFIPQKGDRFELPWQDPGERLVEVGRRIDDGGASILFACILVVS